MDLNSEPVAPEASTLKSIARNVEWVKNSFSEKLGVELNLDLESVEWIDGYINRNREKLKSDAVNNLSSAFGSFLGETIIEVYCGEWSYNDGNLGIYFKDNNSWAFPFAKTQNNL